MKTRSIIHICLIILFSIVISACSLQKDVNVKSIEIIEDTIPDFIAVGEFDNAGIKALITYEDDTTEEISVNSNLLKDSYQKYINSAGDYEFEILFKGESVKFNIKIVDVAKIHKVEFFNGLNELVSRQFVEDGKDAEAPSGQSHLLQGYDFIGWDRSFSNVKEDIEVFAIYAKVEEGLDVEFDYHRLLLESVDNMRSDDLNILDVWELSSKRIEITNYYDELDLNVVVKKEIEDNREISYHKYYKNTTSSEERTYLYEKYDTSGFYSKVAITGDEFIQYDIYNYVKRLISSTDDLRYSTYHSIDQEFYKLVVSVPNTGDGGHDIDEYEILFNKHQIIYLKHYLVEKTSVGVLEKTLTSTRYYTIDLKETEKIVFPTDVNLGIVVESVFSHDVVITTEEMRDMLVVSQIVKNDGDKKEALIVKDSLELYMWDRDEATYYTKEEFGLNESMIRVYKTMDSLKRYGVKYYYEWKNLSNCVFEVNLNEDGSVSFIYNVGESSSIRAHIVEFIVLNNKLISLKKYYYEQNEIIYIEKETFKYDSIDVEIPSPLKNSEPNAILE